MPAIQPLGCSMSSPAHDVKILVAPSHISCRLPSTAQAEREALRAVSTSSFSRGLSTAMYIIPHVPQVSTSSDYDVHRSHRDLVNPRTTSPPRSISRAALSRQLSGVSHGRVLNHQLAPLAQWATRGSWLCPRTDSSVRTSTVTGCDPRSRMRDALRAEGPRLHSHHKVAQGRFNVLESEYSYRMSNAVRDYFAPCRPHSACLRVPSDRN